MTDPLLLDLPDQIETARLVMRPPRVGDGGVLHDAIVESLPELRRFLALLPWVAQEQSVESAEIYCRMAQSNFVARKDLPFLLFEKGSQELVGVAGLHRPVWATPKADVGYWGRVSRSRRGFISEAVERLVSLAFDTLRMVRVELVTDAENTASRQVAARCRFELEGILRDDHRSPDGALRSTCMYARLAPGAGLPAAN